VINRSCTGIMALAALGLAAPARAQTAAPAHGPRLQGASFAIVRATSTGSAAFYGAHGVGPGLAMAGVVAVPGTGYRAIIAGAGSRVRLGTSGGLIAIVAGAQATDGPSVRLYLLPSAAFGRVTMSATATAYQPLGGTVRREAALNPLIVAMRATPALSGGLAVVFHAAAGRSPRTGFGPSLQVRTPVGSASVQFLPFGLARPEVRGSFRAAL
jgi:hypothetical protein